MVDKIWYNMEELIGGSEERVLIETYWNVKEVFDNCNRSGSGVLIETYWNVKNTSSRLPKPSLCINRNILECKDDSSTDERVQKSSINRNILECKGILENAMIIFYIVLIETYWNVKCINADP